MDRSIDSENETGTEDYGHLSQADVLFSFDSITTDDETDLTVAQFDPTFGAPSLAVASLVAAQKGCDPRDLSVMYDTIDPDALDRLFGDERTMQAKGTVSFQYEEYNVTVSPRSIAIQPIH